MVLRSALESLSSHEMPRTPVECQVKTIGTRQVTACFKVHLLNSLGEKKNRKKSKPLGQ
jgi:hypothetical protein